MSVTVRAPVSKLTPNQLRSFWAAWAGWVLDGMDSFIYALVLVPSLHELLPNSDITATTGNIGFYGGLLFALFLIGWGLSFLWGPIADRFGRVRTLILTILCYSVFTFAGALSKNVWELGVFRLLAGIGIGGEWTLGESWLPKNGLKSAACLAAHSCTRDTISEHSSLLWRTTASAHILDGVRCSFWAGLPPC